MDGLVSILVPCYNGERFVDRCVASILGQNYSRVEIIAVNDGSTDRSEECIRSWEERFESAGMRLVCVSQENKGPAGAVNAGLKRVNGEFLTLLDIDEELLPNAVSSRIEFLQAHADMDVVRSNGYYVRKGGKSLFLYDDAEKRTEDVFTALVEGKTNNWAGSYTVRTSALFAFYPDREIYPSRFGQNLQILMPLTYRRRSGFLDEPQMNYHIQENSLSHTSAADPKEQMEIFIKNQKEYCGIRIHLVRQITETREEAENYIRLGKATAVTITDVIEYCRLFCPSTVFPLRCLRKLGSFLRIRAGGEMNG